MPESKPKSYYLFPYFRSTEVDPYYLKFSFFDYSSQSHIQLPCAKGLSIEIVVLVMQVRIYKLEMHQSEERTTGNLHLYA